MNKNSILGFLLIGAILIGFSWYNSKLFKEQEEIKAREDSLVLEQSVTENYSRERERESQDANREEIGSQMSNEATSIYQKEFLAEASRAAESFELLENDKIKIEFTNIGAQIKSVEIKDNFTHDSLALMLIKEQGSQLSLDFYAGQQLSTSNFGFELTSSTANSLSYRLYVDSLSFIEYNYSLENGSHLLDLEIKLVGMEREMPRNLTSLDLEWHVEIPRLERGYKNEKNYSSISYKYPNSKSIENLGFRKEESREDVRTKLDWIAFQQQFFSAILVGSDQFNSGVLSYSFFPEEHPEKSLMNCRADLQIQYEGGEESSIPLQFYFGPNHFKTLKSYDRGFEKIVPLGGSLIGWVNRYIIIAIFDFLNKFIGNYGLIIFLLTIFIKLVISPLTIKSYLSSAKMRVLKPEIDKINAKYPKKEDAMKKQQATMDLYKKTGVNMFGGCLPMLLQFPILFAMFRFFPSSFELRQESFLWAKDLSTYDSILDLPFSIPLYGDHVSLFALLMAISMFIYSRMNMEQMGGGPEMGGMKFMTLYFMPLFLLVLGNNFSSALTYYYLLSNLITMGQTWFIRRYVVDEEKILASLKERAAVPKKRSKFQERLDAAYKAQQEQMKNKK